MLNIIRASLFKLFRDRTFQITAIIGFVLAALTLGVNALVQTANGQTFFLSALTPGSNFGLTIPINLIVFTVGEFTFGTIRNKIIAGLNKVKIYFGLFITGLVFTFILAGAYALILIGLGSAIGGFDVSKIGGVSFALCYTAYVVCTYIFITALSVFFASLFRQIGGAIAVVILILVFVSFLPLIIFASGFGNMELTVEHWSMWINPLYMTGFYGNNIVTILAGTGSVEQFFIQSPSMIAAGIVVPLVWTAIFVIGGLLLFKYTDVK